MYALAKSKPRVWLKLSWIHQKLVKFFRNPLKYVTICWSNFNLLSANRNPYVGRNRNFTETPNFGRYRNRPRNFGLSLKPGFIDLSLQFSSEILENILDILGWLTLPGQEQRNKGFAQAKSCFLLLSSAGYFPKINRTSSCLGPAGAGAGVITWREGFTEMASRSVNRIKVENCCFGCC